MPAPPDYLVTPAQLSRFGVPPAFLAQFAPAAFQIEIVTGGALGTMAWQWKPLSDAAYGASVFATSRVTPWTFTLDDAFADLAFAAGTYVVGDVYTVDETGAVAHTGTGPAGVVTCTRFDLRANACSSATTEALTLMQDAVNQPLLTWGDDTRTHAAAMVHAILKRARGATPQGAGLGDENVFLAEAAAREYFDRIRRHGRPASMTDTSTSSDGPLIPMYPFGSSRGLRGW